MMFTASQVFIVLLCINAAIVAVRQWNAAKKAESFTWVMIALYWVLLTAKNVCDLLGW